ncbi:MAG: hypothetical protein ABIY63_03670, partial [Fibrobacteria bacterium]
MSKRRFPGLLKQARMGIFPVALLVGACLPTEDRVAGGSTEAGNAGGKLSMSDGAPAADVSVALVARSYLPDTLAELGVPAAGRPDSPGAYYRTRTDAAGRYHFRNVPPGDYRVIAMATGLGATADSVAISGTGPEGSAGTEGETSVADQVLKPLGGIRGVVKIVGSQVQTKVLLSSKATLRAPSRSDSETGGFQVDSLPEGEYELVPQCFTCQPVKLGYRIKVKAGRDTLLADTLLVYPEYFYDFPDTGELEVRASWLPLIVGGKVNRGADRNGKPGSIRWDWNGAPLADRRIAAPDGVSSTEVTLDSTWFGTVSQGILRVTLGFSD